VFLLIILEQCHPSHLKAFTQTENTLFPDPICLINQSSKLLRENLLSTSRLGQIPGQFSLALFLSTQSHL
jgi:hypothetical protein